MGNNEAGIPSKPTKASSAVLEQNSAHPYPDWTAMQAYYGFGTNITPTHSSHPYVWPAPFLMSPFGAPYSIYQHGGVCSQSPDIDGVVTPIKSPKNIEPRVLDGSAASDVNGSEETELGSVSNAPSHSESEGRDSCNGRQKKNNRQAYHTGENRGASRGVAEENVARLPVPANPKLPVPVLMEEREGKREKRKQSNRESARRSRLRKQSEAEELAQKVESLVAENRALASEVSQLRQDAARLRLENSALQKKLKATEKSDAGNPVPSAVTENLLSRIESPPEESEKESLIILGQLL